MTDVFIEELVSKKKTRKDYILTALCIAGGIILSLLLIFLALIFGTIVAGFAPLLLAAIWYGVYYILSARNIEYEYSVINNYLDIDKITAKKKRKRVASIDIKNASVMASVKDSEVNSVYLNPPSNVKVLDYSAMSENIDAYFIDCIVDSNRTVVVFQPSKKMVEALWKFNPKAVKKYSD